MPNNNLNANIILASYMFEQYVFKHKTFACAAYITVKL